MKVYITEEQALFLAESALYFIHRNGKLYPMGNAKDIIGKDSITWREFDGGISQRLIKQGYKIGITEAKTPGKVRIFNNSGFLKPGEDEWVKTYPHYFLDFIIKDRIEELENREDTKYVISMCSKIKNRINAPDYYSSNEKEMLKQELANWLLNHEVYSIYLHRFVNDYLIPNYKRQAYVDKLKNHEVPTDDELRMMNNVGITKPKMGSYLDYDYKDFLIS